jgi:starch synthase (maltosyl-transferring)
MSGDDGRRRVVIESVVPEIDAGAFPVKRTTGERLVVSADIFTDGHDEISAVLRFRKEGEQEWREVSMKPLFNDRWEGGFSVEEIGLWHYTIQARVDRFRTWKKDLQKKWGAGQDVGVDLEIGAGLVDKTAEGIPQEDAKTLRAFANSLREEAVGDRERAVSLAMGEEFAALMDRHPDRRFETLYDRELPLVVDRKKALFSTWYEIFPRSCTGEPGRQGTFGECETFLREIARMGFDVIYFPPIHPIGRTGRKGKDNTTSVGGQDPGSPWAIGSEEGGHKSVHPALGTLADFEHFVRKAAEHGIETALDLAFQCSPDHPYVREHPEWFRWRPDGTIQFAENPPKKYEDIIPFDFESDDWWGLWEELKSIVVFWIEKGVKTFRVDNPHTKPFAFWVWLIAEIKKDHPEVLFLAEAFTRPKVMNRLAKVGFSQSYTYFTWRNTRRELTEYLQELTATGVREYLRPNFWPNTPDILHEYLQYGGRPAFMVRLVLAATLSSNYGIYGPSFELLVNEAVPGKEEYLGSEKYEIRHWDWNKPGSLKDFITTVNRVRRENPALQTTWNLNFFETDNENILYYVKTTEDFSNILLVVVNLDPFHKQAFRLQVPLRMLGISPGQPYLVHDLLSGDKYIWQEEWNSLELDPRLLPAALFTIRRRLRREQDFDYFM